MKDLGNIILQAMRVGLPCFQANAFSFPMFKLLFWRSPFHRSRLQPQPGSSTTRQRHGAKGNRWAAPERRKSPILLGWKGPWHFLGPIICLFGVWISMTVCPTSRVGDSSPWEPFNELQHMCKLGERCVC